jgi:hypothetical protein
MKITSKDQISEALEPLKDLNIEFWTNLQPVVEQSGIELRGVSTDPISVTLWHRRVGEWTLGEPIAVEEEEDTYPVLLLTPWTPTLDRDIYFSSSEHQLIWGVEFQILSEDEIEVLKHAADEGGYIVFEGSVEDALLALDLQLPDWTAVLEQLELSTLREFSKLHGVAYYWSKGQATLVAELTALLAEIQDNAMGGD